MPKWLWRSVIAMAAATAALSIAQWMNCAFVVAPRQWPFYAKYIGTDVSDKLQPRVLGCEDNDNRTIAVMMSLLTTLISLSRQTDEK
jgi:hypothetical protein